LPGTVIGKNSIIGANSVVSKNIPENCIAVGNPAKVIKKYNFETKKWEKI
jgi:protein CpsI